uniref:39S ribosomal protein L47, mitochondrial-like n=1 Tax=Styela clava TaxID=7725 RepID=UPI001939B3E4|nr:39S ribosomal protein L47, mitochondrial-like [Styela clava]
MLKGVKFALCTAFQYTYRQKNSHQISNCIKSAWENIDASNTLKVSRRNIYICTRDQGLEEFFEPPKNIGHKHIKSAAPWSRDLLRLKSSEDLHKLWFVLLKERNMLETMQFHYETVDEPMPSPERLEKVAESMSNLRDVLEEREKSINMLLLGRPTKAHGEYRKSGLGATYWYQYKPHVIPKELAKDVYGDKPADLASFNMFLHEWHIRFQERREKVWARRKSALRLKWIRIRENNPSLPKSPPKWWLDRFKCKLRYGLHPEVQIYLQMKNSTKRKIPYPKRYHSDY